VRAVPPPPPPARPWRAGLQGRRPHCGSSCAAGCWLLAVGRGRGVSAWPGLAGDGRGGACGGVLSRLGAGAPAAPAPRPPGSHLPAVVESRRLRPSVGAAMHASRLSVAYPAGPASAVRSRPRRQPSSCSTSSPRLARPRARAAAKSVSPARHAAPRRAAARAASADAARARSDVCGGGRGRHVQGSQLSHPPIPLHSRRWSLFSPRCPDPPPLHRAVYRLRARVRVGVDPRVAGYGWGLILVTSILHNIGYGQHEADVIMSIARYGPPPCPSDSRGGGRHGHTRGRGAAGRQRAPRPARRVGRAGRAGRGLPDPPPSPPAAQARCRR
jgi:hypothetical protein